MLDYSAPVVVRNTRVKDILEKFLLVNCSAHVV